MALASTAHIHKPPRSENGASVIIALLLFLVCATIAAIIVGSASTSVERTSRHAVEERGYFAVSSALRQGQVAFETYKPTVRVTTAGDSVSLSFTKPKVKSGQWSEYLQGWICDELEDKLKNSASDHGTFTTDVEVSGQPGEALPKVQLTYTMAGNYKGGCDVTVSARETAQGDAPTSYGKVLSATYEYVIKADSAESDTATAYWKSQLTGEDTTVTTPASDGPRDGDVLTEKEMAQVKLYGGWGNNSSRYTWVWITQSDAAGAECLIGINSNRNDIIVGLFYYDGSYYRAHDEAEGDGTPDAPIALPGDFKVSHLTDGAVHTAANGRSITYKKVSV